MKKVFISYSHIDEDYKKAFETHLSGLKRQNLIVIWNDREVLIGDEWDDKIKENLETSDIILFMISSDFLASEYINEIEINKTIARHEKKEVKIVPVFLRPCDFKSSILSKFQGVPRDTKYITSSDNIDLAFLEVVNELKKIIEDFNKSITPKQNPPEINSSVDIKTLHQALDLYIEQKDKLGSKTSKNEFEEIEKLRTELFNNMFGDFNQKISEIPHIKNQAVVNLFERVISTEKLTPIIITEINDLRKNYSNFQSYDRSVIVSSLTLSVLSWHTFDIKKIDLLIDFLTDFEPETWQKSLTGIFISIIIHQNRLQRFPNIIQRLESLQKIEDIQIGIYLLDTILRKQLYEFAFFPNETEENDYLSKTPYNWFYPFYIENELITEAINCTELDSEIDNFMEYIKQMPLISAYKYSLCNSFKSSKLVRVKIDDKDARLERLQRMNTAIMFEPYFNFVSEIYLYYKYFPVDRVQKLFESKITIAQTKLKNIVLNKIQSLKLSADLHYERKEYGDCILKLRELLNISPNQYSSLKQITDCLLKKGENLEALTYLFQIEKVKPDNEGNIFNIGLCLNQTDQYSKSNEYLLRLLDKHSNNEDLLGIIANNYEELKLYDKSIEICLSALNVNSENTRILHIICTCYLSTKKPNLALEYGLRLSLLKPDSVKSMINLSNIYVEIDKSDLALELSEKAFITESNNIDTTFDYGRKLFISGNFSKAKIILNKILSFKKNKSFLGITYGNLGHINLFENNLTESDLYYKKCVLEFSDILDFEEKFDSDIKYALNVGISKEKYDEIKNELILYWKMNN